MTEREAFEKWWFPYAKQSNPSLGQAAFAAFQFGLGRANASITELKDAITLTESEIMADLPADFLRVFHAAKDYIEKIERK